MNKEYINFLNFRTELIELLHKYKYEISGTGLDDGSMSISDEKNSNSYILKDSYSDYEVTDNDYNILSTDYILEMFPENNNNYFTSNMIGVFSNNYYKVSEFFMKLYNENKDNIENFRSNTNEMDLLFKDGINYIWIKPRDSSRGYRCRNKVYIDRNLTLNELGSIIKPVCCYCERKDINIF